MNECPFEKVLIPVCITSDVGYYTYPCMSRKFMKWEKEYIQSIIEEDENNEL